MRFSEKLPKLRKNNNLSQEQLAEQLGVSRQAVSKWEAGNSYPDMEKMLQMCKILNCHLEDLMDDGSIGNISIEGSKNKIDLNVCMQDFLNFITKLYNMFVSMRLKGKIKFVFEMVFIILILLLSGLLIMRLLEYIIYGILPLPILWKILSKVIMLILIAVGGVIFIHLLKIRYLDYYVTIEDQNTTQKSIEEPIEKTENRHYEEKSKEKIIIRDPKHSGPAFLKVIEKIIVIMIKLFMIFIAIPVVIGFVIDVGCTVVSLYHIIYGNIFAGIAFVGIGIALILYSFMELAFNFIVDKEQHFKKIFIIAIIGLITCGVGAGIAIGSYINFEHVSTNQYNEYKTLSQEIPMSDNLWITKNYEHEYIIDNSIGTVNIEVKYLNGIEPKLEIENRKNSNDENYQYCLVTYDTNRYMLYKNILQDIKNKKLIDYENLNSIKLKITVSQENYEKLQQNYEKYCKQY